MEPWRVCRSVVADSHYFDAVLRIRIRNTGTVYKHLNQEFRFFRISYCAGALEQKMGEAQRARAERNRLKALSLQKARLMAHPYTAGQQQAGTGT
jgi:hypothetical protein